MAGGSNGVPVFSGKVESFVERLESYFEFHGTADEKKKHVLIMGLSDAQYETLTSLTSPQKPKEKEYNDLVTLLQSHFGQATNKMVERAKFRDVRRGVEEDISGYVVRLRAQARTCQFGTSLDENLLEQFLIGVNSKAIRDRIASMTDERQGSLQEVVKMAQQVEIDEKIDRMSVSEQPETVGAVSRPGQHSERSSRGMKFKLGYRCFCCNRAGHLSSSKECPAIGRTCKDCNRKGHFASARFCNGKTSVSNVSTGFTADNSAQEDDTRNLFTVQQVTSRMPRCEVTVMGESIPFIIDTGACNNIIDVNTFNRLTRNRSLTLNRTDQHNLFAYGSACKLDVLGKFDAVAYCNERSAKAVFYVYNGLAKCLLSFKTATDLSLVSCSKNVLCSILPDISNDIMKQFPEVFNGLGKLRGYKVKFHIDHSVEPVSQPVRRLPLGLRDKVRSKLDSLEAAGVVERAVGVRSEWVSLLVCFVKDNGDIRHTVDMRQANRAIARERHPLPTTKEMLANLEGGKVFSKLDMNQGFHQIELDEDSRPITTFSTPFGLYRYKRLTMGVNASPEYFQYIVQTECVWCTEYDG